MTQAFNLSQLANNLNSSGQIDATDGLVNAVPIANGGTGASSAEAARTNLGAASADFAMPFGGIIMWSGAQSSIPSGWLLCNGANGTPDLRDRFVVGAGSLYGVGASGGSKDAIVVNHTHTASSSVNDPGHNHGVKRDQTPGTANVLNVSQGVSNFNPIPDVTLSSTTGISVSTSISSSGSSGVNANLPPYYALCFIMKS